MRLTYGGLARAPGASNLAPVWATRPRKLDRLEQGV